MSLHPMTGVPSERRFGVPTKARIWRSWGEVLRLLGVR